MPLTSEADSSPRMTGPDLIPSSHCCCLLYLLPFFHGRTMPLSAFPTSDCWICHRKPQSIQESNDPLAHPIRNSTGISDTVVCLNCSAGPFCQVRVLSPPKLMPCFNFTQPWEVKTRSIMSLSVFPVVSPGPSPCSHPLSLLQLNHFPGSFQIGRKDRLWRNLSRMQSRFGKKEFSFFPQSFILPQDAKLLRKAWESSSRQKWIVKPVSGHSG